MSLGSVPMYDIDIPYSDLSASASAFRAAAVFTTPKSNACVTCASSPTASATELALQCLQEQQ